MMETSKNNMMSFSAVLMAGGMSRRMGQDKATLRWGEGFLWEWQLQKLQTLKPAELFISTRSDQRFEAPGAMVLVDARNDLGPLAGLSAALNHLQTDWLLVLAVDLPEMSADFLASLLQKAIATGKGVIPELNGWFEPLAAVYPKKSAALALDLLEGADRSLQNFVRRSVECGWVKTFPVTEKDRRQFHNVNTPADLA